MSAAKKPSPKKTPSPKRALPPALRERAKALSATAHARHLKDARAALSRAKTALEGAERGLYEVALALKDLDDPKRLAALDAKSIYALAQEHLGLSRSTVDRLRRAADAVDAARFSELGHTRVNAMLELADATTADDTDAILAERTVTLWEGGPSLDVKAASAKQITAAAAEVRAQQAAQGAPTERRGNRVKTEDRALAASLADALKARGVTADVKARATKPGSPARFEVTGISGEEVRALITVLAAGKAQKPR